MKKKTRLKIRYAVRAHKTLFMHPLVSFKIGNKDVNIYQFIRFGWDMIDHLYKS